MIKLVFQLELLVILLNDLLVPDKFTTRVHIARVHFSVARTSNGPVTIRIKGSKQPRQRRVLLINGCAAVWNSDITGR